MKRILFAIFAIAVVITMKVALAALKAHTGV